MKVNTDPHVVAVLQSAMVAHDRAAVAAMRTARSHIVAARTIAAEVERLAPIRRSRFVDTPLRFARKGNRK